MLRAPSAYYGTHHSTFQRLRVMRRRSQLHGRTLVQPEREDTIQGGIPLVVRLTYFSAAEQTCRLGTKHSADIGPADGPSLPAAWPDRVAPPRSLAASPPRAIGAGSGRPTAPGVPPGQPEGRRLPAPSASEGVSPGTARRASHHVIYRHRAAPTADPTQSARCRSAREIHEGLLSAPYHRCSCNRCALWASVA